jgi:MFS family permease
LRISHYLNIYSFIITNLFADMGMLSSSYNISLCLIIGFGGFTYGFGAAGFITSIGQPGFYQYFKLDPISNYTSNIIGAINALWAFGCALGALSQGWISDWRGRRVGLAIAAGCALLGAALVAGSVNIPMLIVVRMVQGFGLGMILAIVPLYLSEVAPPRQRGFMTGLTVLSFGMGYTMQVECRKFTFHRY